MISYKNYKSYFEYDEKGNIFHGQVIGTQDIATQAIEAFLRQENVAKKSG